MVEDQQPLSPAAAAKIKALREAQRRDKRIVMSSADVEEALRVGGTRVRELLENGELSSILDGKLRRIFADSVYNYLVRRIIESDPVDGPPAKSPIGRFKARKGTAPEAVAIGAGESSAPPALEGQASPRPAARPATCS